ncbi:MAG TPA: class II fumarate hydratase, partial [Candidatus Acidoferrum sp.]|nr:class II fumarate hydratase [Candidatus Acidoferrum sp.]
MSESFRIEHDTMGDVKVSASAYYGAETQRAIENFQISGRVFPRRFIRALAIVKAAAAEVNMRLGIIDEKKGKAIARAAQEVVDGKFDPQFVVDIFQTGSGTSTNMNANEVIANRAIELLGGIRGDRQLIHPNDHVNMSQSSNDVFPTAIHISASEAIATDLLPALKELALALEKKAEEFADVVKPGRTHLQDAVPITLGQEFSGYASMIAHGIERIERARTSLLELPIGGTAIGTGLNAHPDFGRLVVQRINEITGLEFSLSRNKFEAFQNRDAAVETSGALRSVAVSLMKIANDLRLLSSGPDAGFGEIELPAVQPGSSIMPGKVNPVIPESVNMVCAQVLGNDLTITLAGQSGSLELNTMMPLIAFNLLQSTQLEGNAARLFAAKCIVGIRANRERCLELAERSYASVTAIAPLIGYDRAAQIVSK